MVDSKYIRVDYKSPKISIEAIMKNDHLDTIKISKHAAKELLFVARYVLDRYETKMCNKAVLETGRLLESIAVCYKNCQICDKTYDNYPHALKQKKKKKMCNKAIDTYPFTIPFVSECCKTEGISDKAVSTFFSI